MIYTDLIDFVPNTIIYSAEVDQNFEDVVDYINTDHHTNADGTKVSFPNGLNFTGSNLTSILTRLFTNLQFTGSNLTSILTRNHNDTQNKQGGSGSDFYHLTSAQHTAVTGTVITIRADDGNTIALSLSDILDIDFSVGGRSYVSGGDLKLDGVKQASDHANTQTDLSVDGTFADFLTFTVAAGSGDGRILVWAQADISMADTATNPATDQDINFRVVYEPPSGGGYAALQGRTAPASYGFSDFNLIIDFIGFVDVNEVGNWSFKVQAAGNGGANDASIKSRVMMSQHFPD